MSTQESKLTRRQTLRLMGGSVIATFLAACGPSAGPTEQPAGAEGTSATAAPGEEATPVPTPAVTPRPAAAGATPLELWCAWSGGEDAARIQVMVNEFTEKHENIAINYLGGGPGGGDYNELLLSRIAAGNAPDVAHIWTAPAPFAARGSLEAMDDLMANAQYARADKFVPVLLKSGQYRGKTYAIAWSGACNVIAYNTDWMAERGMKTDRDSFPKTWDEMRAFSKEFVAWEGDELKTGGFVPFFELWVLPAMSASFGAKIYDGDTLQYSIDAPGNVELMEYWLSWLDEQYRGDIDYLASLGSWNAYPNTLWSDKRTPVAFAGSWCATYKEMRYEDMFRWDMGKMLASAKGKGYTSYWPNWWTMPTGGKHRAEAFLLVEWMTTIGFRTWYEEVYETPAWLDFPRDLVPKNLLYTVGEEKGKDLVRLFLDYVNTEAVEMWTSPIDDFGTDQVNRAVDQILHKVKPPKEILGETQRVVQAKLDEFLKSG